MQVFTFAQLILHILIAAVGLVSVPLHILFFSRTKRFYYEIHKPFQYHRHHNIYSKHIRYFVEEKGKSYIGLV